MPFKDEYDVEFLAPLKAAEKYNCSEIQGFYSRPTQYYEL